jgi:UDP-3-O-[3-hydroxymyristoyl] glucosamine N-acyltransferase
LIEKGLSMEGHHGDNWTVASLAAWLKGTLVGDGNLPIRRARTLTQAESGDISFLESERNAHLLQKTAASAVLVPEKLVVENPRQQLIRVADPLDAFVRVFRVLHHVERSRPVGVHPSASVSASARFGRDVSVGPFAVVGDDVAMGDRCQIHAGAVVEAGCRLGNDVVVHSHAVLYSETVVGNRVVIHAGAVLGKDGFGFRVQRGRHVRIPQLGTLAIGDDTEIGANTTIDRSTFDVTRIGPGTKIDNQVQIGHNCQIGAHNMLVAQVGISGSCKTGEFVTIAGQAGVCNQVAIGDRAVIAAAAGVMNNIPADVTIIGQPGEPEHDARRIYATFRRLPEMRQELRELEKRVSELADRIAAPAPPRDESVAAPATRSPEPERPELRKSA